MKKRMRSGGARALSSAVLVAALSALGCTEGERVEAAEQLARGEELFDQHCTTCHGTDGEADGPAAHLLFPPPRDFTRGRFELATTANGMPSDADLVATLRRGMPGSAMPSFGWMSDADLLELARYVRELAVLGLAKDLRAEAPRGGEDPLVRARSRLMPGAPVEVDPPVASTPQNLARGEILYRAQCAGCHGEDGKGRSDVLRRDEDETMNWARDLTAGILAGGTSHEELAARVRVGLHGSAMPGTRLDAAELSLLVTWLRTLIPEGAEERLVQRRETLVVERVEADLAERPDSAPWQALSEIDIVLAPLWWRDDAVVRARVAGAHDGETIALRIRWPDATVDVPADMEWPLEAPQYADAVAVQLSPLEHPPFFGMGERATNILHWRAIELPEMVDPRELADLLPHRIGEWLIPERLRELPLYELAQGPLVVEGESAAVAPAGMKVLAEQQALPDAPTSYAMWKDGEWEVFLLRRLEPRSEREIDLSPGATASLGLAIWNGAARDLRGQKSVTIWHALRMAP